jgi:hypothetical protein
MRSSTPPESEEPFFRVEVNGLEPSASTLRIQSGLSADLGICGNTQLDRGLGALLATTVDRYSPLNRARIAHERATTTAIVQSASGPLPARSILVTRTTSTKVQVDGTGHVFDTHRDIRT